MSVLRLHQLNDVRLVGRLTHDPELRFTSRGQAVCRFNIAVNRSYKDSSSGEWKDDVSFIPIVVWRDTGQRCADRLKKGSPVYVEGRLLSRSWETKEGQKRTGMEVDARRVQFLAKVEGDGSNSGSNEDVSEPAAVSSAGSASAGPEEDIPF